MAYISKAEIQEKRKQVNALCNFHGVSATVSGANTSSVTVTIRKGKIDFLGNHVETVKAHWVTNDQQTIDNAQWYAKKGYFYVNPYYTNMQFSGTVFGFISELLSILKDGHRDNNDVMSDRFECLECAWYYHIKIGTHDKPYLLVTKI